LPLDHTVVTAQRAFSASMNRYRLTGLSLAKKTGALLRMPFSSSSTRPSPAAGPAPHAPPPRAPAARPPRYPPSAPTPAPTSRPVELAGHLPQCSCPNCGWGRPPQPCNPERTSGAVDAPGGPPERDKPPYLGCPSNWVKLRVRSARPNSRSCLALRPAPSLLTNRTATPQLRNSWARRTKRTIAKLFAERHECRRH